MRLYALALVTSISILTHNTDSSETSSLATIHTNTTATGGPPDRHHDGVPASRPRRAQENTIGEERQPKSLEPVVDLAASALSNIVQKPDAFLRVLHESVKAERKAFGWAGLKRSMADQQNGARKKSWMKLTDDTNHANDRTGNAVESVGARQAEIEKLQETAKLVGVDGHEEISVGARQAEMKKLREIAKLMEVDSYDEILAGALQAEMKKLREIASLDDDGHKKISEAISKVVKDAKFYAPRAVRGRSEIPSGSLDLAILRRDIAGSALNPASPLQLLKALIRYFKGDVAKLATFFADARCNMANRKDILLMQRYLYKQWIEEGLTTENVASLLKISLQETNLFASKNLDTWIRYIGAYVDYLCYFDDPNVVEFIVWKMMHLIGKRETARLFASGWRRRLGAFDKLEIEMFEQWKEIGYSPESFSWDTYRARNAKLTPGLSERAALFRYEKHLN